MATLGNTLALMRFGHFGGRGGASGLLFVVGLLFAGVLIWAITRQRPSAN
jgi:hypothetical protein